MPLTTDLKKATIDSPYVEMIELDGRSISSTLFFHFTASSDIPFSFGGQEYIPFPYQGEGWETTTGQSPRPKLVISNATKLVQPYLQQFQDLKRVKVTRIRTLAKYLDGGASPDSTQHLPIEVYYINTMSRMDRSSIEFELVNGFDLPTAKLPAAQALKDDIGGGNMFCPGLSSIRFRG